MLVNRGDIGTRSIHRSGFFLNERASLGKKERIFRGGIKFIEKRDYTTFHTPDNTRALRFILKLPGVY